MIPSRYENLPREVKFQGEKERDLMAKYMRTLANSGVSAVSTLFDPAWDIMTDYEKILTHVLKEKQLVKKVAGIQITCIIANRSDIARGKSRDFDVSTFRHGSLIQLNLHVY